MRKQYIVTDSIQWFVMYNVCHHAQYVPLSAGNGVHNIVAVVSAPVRMPLRHVLDNICA